MGTMAPKTPRPTYHKDPKPTKTPRPTMVRVKTPRPTMHRDPKPTKTPRPTMAKTSKTPRPTPPPKTARPTNPPKTKAPKPTKTPKPTVWKAPKTTKAPKTPRPTIHRDPFTPKPTNPPKTPRPSMIRVKTPKPTNPPKTTTTKAPKPTVTYIAPTPRPTTPWLKTHSVDLSQNYQHDLGISDEDFEVSADHHDADHDLTCPDEADFGGECRYKGTCKYDEVSCCGKSYYTTVCKCENKRSSCIVKDFCMGGDDNCATAKPTKDKSTYLQPTPKNTYIQNTPKPTKAPKTPKPTSWKAPKTPKPTNPPKTPKPTFVRVKTPKPTDTPRPTEIKTTKVKTPKPTVWKAPKTPKPTNPPKTKPPKPTKPVKTPKPTPVRIKTPKPTKMMKTPKPTAVYLQPTPRPTPDQSGWGVDKPSSVPLRGCAQYLSRNKCSPDCVWKSGFPPLSFSEDANYQFVDEEFSMNGGLNELLSNVDFQMFFGIGLLIAAVLIFAYRQYSIRREKALNGSETTPLVMAA